MSMNQDPALTPERTDALAAVDLRLFGVRHGITETVDGMLRVRGADDADFDGLLDAASDLNLERGDALAIEPTGFRSSWAEDLQLANVVSANIPDIPVADMPSELRTEIASLLEVGRAELRLNSLVYAAAHTLLRGAPVHRAEVSREEWQALQDLLPELAPPEGRTEISLFYRNTKMLARLGDVAIGMMRAPSQGVATRPILLFGAGRAHPPRLAKRLSASGVPFSSNL